MERDEEDDDKMSPMSAHLKALLLIIYQIEFNVKIKH